MPIQRVLQLINNAWSEYVAKDVSTGASDAGNLVALNSAGKIDTTMMPTGVGAATAIVNATEALSAGNLVNIWDNSGTPGVRKADASTTGKQADGFVLTSAASGAAATVYLAGQLTGLTGLTAGKLYFLSTTAGGVALTGASVAGQVFQQVGIAYSSSAIDFTPQEPILRA